MRKVKKLKDRIDVENKAISPKKKRPMLFIVIVLIIFVIYKFSLLNYFGFVTYLDAKNIIKDFEKNYLYNEAFFDKEYAKMRSKLIEQPFTTKAKINALISYAKQLSKDEITNFSYADLLQGKINYSLYKNMEFQSKKIDKNTCYIKFSSFGENAEKKFSKAIEKMGNLEYLILDLRGNQMGYHKEAIEITDDLLPGNMAIAAIEFSNSKHFYSSNDFFYNFKKIFVLLDEDSACCSELLALALKENLNDKVELIGKKTKYMDVGQVYKVYYNKINFSIAAFRWNVNNQTSEGLKKYLNQYEHTGLSSLEDYMKAVEKLK